MKGWMCREEGRKGGREEGGVKTESSVIFGRRGTESGQGEVNDPYTQFLLSYTLNQLVSSGGYHKSN